MKKLNVYFILIASIVIGMTSCEIDELSDPNGPSSDTFAQDATSGDLQLLVSGLQAVQRNDMEFYFETVSIVGRDYYDLNDSDPRYTGELLGKDGGSLDNNGFLTTRAFAAKHRAIRNAHVLIQATNNSIVDDDLKLGYTGFAQTIQAYEMLLELGRQYENGIRINTSDADNLGPYSAGYQAGLDGVMGILNDGFDDLSAASDINFVLSTGFNDLSSKEGLMQFNRAIAARVALYQGEMGDALAILDESFFNLDGSLTLGAYHTFSGNANDQFNPLFYVPGPENAKYAIHPSFLTDAETDDARVAAKTDPWGETLSADELSGDTQITLFPSNTAPFPMIRNEELILIYAEANMLTGPLQAVDAINIIRDAAGLTPYLGLLDEESLTDEILKQRRYSLVGEGHRWIDMRRFGRLDQIPTDREGDVVHTQFPRPITEG